MFRTMVMRVPLSHAPLSVDGTWFSLEHLDAAEARIIGKGLQAGTDLPVMIAWSSHVFSRRAKHGETSHLTDHLGVKRVFDAQRYEMSKDLPLLLHRKIEQNTLVRKSRSFGGVDNLVVLETQDGRYWYVVFCLWPNDTQEGVIMDVLSAHPRSDPPARTKHQHLSYYARMCLFAKSRIPK